MEQWHHGIMQNWGIEAMQPWNDAKLKKCKNGKL